MHKIFVYGIFLDDYMREQYGMVSPRYATVEGYATRAVSPDGTIVEAVPVQGNYFLTGLVVDMPKMNTIQTVDGGEHRVKALERLDRLENGYDRISVTTTDGEVCQMYVTK